MQRIEIENFGPVGNVEFGMMSFRKLDAASVELNEKYDHITEVEYAL